MTVSLPGPVASVPAGAIRAPHVVTLATQLMWASLGFQAGAALLQSARDRSTVVFVASLIGLVLVAFLQKWIIGRLLIGQNWMRIVLLVCSIIGLAFVKQFVQRDLPLIASGDAVAFLDTISWLANLVGVGLLFSPHANTWFRKRHAGAA